MPEAPVNREPSSRRAGESWQPLLRDRTEINPSPHRNILLEADRFALGILDPTLDQVADRHQPDEGAIDDNREMTYPTVGHRRHCRGDRRLGTSRYDRRRHHRSGGGIDDRRPESVQSRDNVTFRNDPGDSSAVDNENGADAMVVEQGDNRANRRHERDADDRPSTNKNRSDGHNASLSQGAARKVRSYVSTCSDMICRFATKGKTMADADREPLAAPGHWRRFRRLMGVMFGLAVLAIALALALLHAQGVVFHLHFVIALGLGIGVSLMLAGALMGLVFISASSGHDEEVERHNAPRDDPRR